MKRHHKSLALSMALVLALGVPARSADEPPAAVESAATDPATAPVTETPDPPDKGLTVLAKRPLKLGWSALFDIISVGDKLVAVGSAALISTQAQCGVRRIPH